MSGLIGSPDPPPPPDPPPGSASDPSTGSTLSLSKYVKCFRVETSCYLLVLCLNFIVNLELLYNQAESDFVQCQTKMRAWPPESAVNLNKLNLIEIELLIKMGLVFSTTRPRNKQISARDASQPSSQEL